jgi:hypothetical protein
MADLRLARLGISQPYRADVLRRIATYKEKPIGQFGEVEEG